MALPFTIHTEASAPEASRPVLEAARKGFGFVPNLHAILAESPTALAGYEALWNQVAHSSFSPAEQQVAYLAVNYANDCHYCMAGHSVLAKMAGLDPASVAALREGRSLADPKLEALRLFAGALTVRRGELDDAEVEAFLAAGYTKRHVLDAILVVATKTLSNYVNHLARTPLDPFMKDTVWSRTQRAA